MTVGRALEEVQSPEFAKRLDKASSVGLFIVLTEREDAVVCLADRAKRPAVWHRLFSRLTVLVNVPTIMGETCEEDIAAAVLLWILQDGPVGRVAERLRRDSIWRWGAAVADLVLAGGG